MADSIDGPGGQTPSESSQSRRPRYQAQDSPDQKQPNCPTCPTCPNPRKRRAGWSRGLGLREVSSCSLMGIKSPLHRVRARGSLYDPVPTAHHPGLCPQNRVQVGDLKLSVLTPIATEKYRIISPGFPESGLSLHSLEFLSPQRPWGCSCGEKTGRAPQVKDKRCVSPAPTLEGPQPRAGPPPKARFLRQPGRGAERAPYWGTACAAGPTGNRRQGARAPDCI